VTSTDSTAFPPERPDDVETFRGLRYVEVDGEHYFKLIFEDESKVVSLESDTVPYGLRESAQQILNAMDSPHADEDPLQHLGEL